jgi:adenosine deaminase
MFKDSMDFKRLPKIELHLHLDCSLSFDVVKRLVPGITKAEFNRKFKAPSKCNDLADYISRAESAIHLMQSKNNLTLVVFDLFEQLKKDHVIYAEIRFAPLLHIREGLTAEEVVETVNDATEACIKNTGIEAGIILCTLRHFTEAESLETIEMARKFRHTRVCGFDIAADEAGFPIDQHIRAFNLAHSLGIPCTAHAGEACGANSVAETLDRLKPSRIGHGVRSLENEQLANRLVSEDIHLEVCPTSNVIVNVFDTIRDHNIDSIYNKGISMSVNTDGRTLSDVTLTSEYNLLQSNFDWGIHHFKKCNLEAIRHAFTTKEVKDELVKKLLREYNGKESIKDSSC